MKPVLITLALIVLGSGGWYLASNGRCVHASAPPDFPTDPAMSMCFVVWNDPTTAWAWHKPGLDPVTFEDR